MRRVFVMAMLVAGGCWSTIGSATLYGDEISDGDTGGGDGSPDGDEISDGDTGGGDASPDGDTGAGGVAVELSPVVVTLAPAATQQFVASVSGAADTSVEWRVEEANGGSISSAGLYTAPSLEGTFHVRATSAATPSMWAEAAVTVLAADTVKAIVAPPVPSGQLTVRLYPAAGVSAATSTLVTFGLPFPRGSLASADLAHVRVIDGGGEVAAFVEELTPWRHLADATRDGTSVRVARIQLRHSFTNVFPGYDTVTVEWGGAARTLSESALIDPRTGWHLVTAGSFSSSDGVHEPDVLAVLPASWLAQGLLRPMPTRPFDASVTEERSDPTAMDATEHWSGYSEAEHAFKNFFYTVINQDDPLVTAANDHPYLTASEPWLYDRPATMFDLYFASGFVTALREAVRAAEFYRQHLYAPGITPANLVGVFDLKCPVPADYCGPNGAMYSYAESLADAYWTTGDELMGEPIRWVTAASVAFASAEPMRWSPTASSWTERHTAIRLLNHVIAYEVFGDSEYANAVRTWTGDLVWHQDGAGGALPADRVDGGLWHLMVQHEGVGGPLMASAWMSVLTVDAMVRAYLVTGDDAVAHFVRRMGTFLTAGSKRVSPTLYEYSEGDSLLREVDYITQVDGTTFPGDGTTPEHALEVAGSVAWAYYFSRLTGAPDAALRDVANELYLTFDIGVNYWTRPAGPASGLAAFRVSPPRKWGWQHRPSGSLSWALGD